MRTNYVLDLDRRDILASPSERVTQSIAKVHVAKTITHHEIARVECVLTLLEHVFDNLLLGRLFVVGIAVESCLGCLAYDTNEKTFLSVLAANAKSIAVSNRIHLIVNLDQVIGQEVEERVDERHKSACADF